MRQQIRTHGGSRRCGCRSGLESWETAGLDGAMSCVLLSSSSARHVASSAPWHLHRLWWSSKSQPPMEANLLGQSIWRRRKRPHHVSSPSPGMYHLPSPPDLLQRFTCKGTTRAAGHLFDRMCAINLSLTFWVLYFDLIVWMSWHREKIASLKTFP